MTLGNDNRTREPDRRVSMLSSARRMGYLVTGAAAVAGTVLLGAGTAMAQPLPPPVPPPCSAAEMARVLSGVTFDTSNYLTLHPAVNDFFTGLKGQPKDQIGQQVQNYFDANPQIRDELQRIRQPSIDFRNRCGLPVTPGMS
jgi:heme-binding protein